MVKKSQNLKKSLFFNQQFLKKKIAKKKCYPLVLPNEVISLRPELSSSPRFKTQGGQTKDGNPYV